MRRPIFPNRKHREMSKKNDWLVYGEGHADITLSRAMHVDGVPVSKLRMREPNVTDQMASSEAKGTDASREILMFGNLCEVTVEDVMAMPLRDYTRLRSAFLGFID